MRSILPLLAVVFVLTSLLSSRTFADIGDCANPVEVWIDQEVTMKFCEIPAAEGVLIGSTPRNFSAFQIGQYEVTLLQYRTGTGGGHVPTYWKESFRQDGFPVLGATHEDATFFARIMGLIDRTAEYRLPTGAEWEYAANAGTQEAFYWGDEFDPDYFWGDRTLEEGPISVTSCPNSVRDVEEPGYCANAFGLMHMFGNVAEFTIDIYGGYDEDFEPPIDGHKALGADTKRLHTPPFYATCGGGYARKCRGASYRSEARSNTRYHSFGFRLVRFPK